MSRTESPRASISIARSSSPCVWPLRCSRMAERNGSSRQRLDALEAALMAEAAALRAQLAAARHKLQKLQLINAFSKTARLRHAAALTDEQLLSEDCVFEQVRRQMARCRKSLNAPRISFASRVRRTSTSRFSGKQEHVRARTYSI